MNDDTISYLRPCSQKRRASATASKIRRAASSSSRSVSSWVRSGIEAIGLSGRGDIALHAFADTLQQTCDPDEIQSTLARLAFELSGAARVELHRSVPSGRISKRVASWPEAESAPARDDSAAPLCLPVSLGGRTWGTLHLWTARRRRWAPRMIRRLTTLGLLAAAAERAARASRGAGTATPFDSITGLYNEPFLAALLTHALAQARRRHEPLALLYIGLDIEPGTGACQAPELAEAALQHVAQAIVRTLRSSDIIARRDDDRLVAVLLAADADAALVVAEAVRQAIAEASFTSGTPTPLTASVGVAAYNGRSATAETLLAVGAEALALAQSQGGDRVATVLGRTDAAPLTLVPRTGEKPISCVREHPKYQQTQVSSSQIGSIRYPDKIAR
jgi:diguanylate cyclase (GGDEF)-like protein